jgi:predicted TIM-barrel fold metal-dependent hydrolase
MALLGEELLISADSHVIEDPYFWENRLPASFKDHAPVFPERQVGGLFQAHPGDWDPHERVQEMAMDGVSGEVLYPSFALDLFGLQDAALQEACFRVYNDWIMEYCAVAPERLYGVACIPTYDIDHGVAELQRCRQAGLPAAMVWQAPPPELSFATDHYERLWAAAQDLEVPISLHILTGQPFPWPRQVNRGGRRQAFQTMRSAVNSKLLHASNAVSDLIMTGVLERYPRLKFVLVENEVSWIPFYLGQYDKYWSRGNRGLAAHHAAQRILLPPVLRHLFQRSAGPLDLRPLGQQQFDVVQRLSPSEFDLAQVPGGYCPRSGPGVGGDAGASAARERAGAVSAAGTEPGGWVGPVGGRASFPEPKCYGDRVPAGGPGDILGASAVSTPGNHGRIGTMNTCPLKPKAPVIVLLRALDSGAAACSTRPPEGYRKHKR